MTAGGAADAGALTVDASPDGYERLRAFVELELRSRNVPESALVDLLIALDEVVTNIIAHGYAGMPPGPIRVELGGADGRVELRISDRARPFDPAQAPPPDLSGDWQSRPVGGLGWYLVRSLMDELHYAPGPEGGNVLTLVKQYAGAAGHRGERA